MMVCGFAMVISSTSLPSPALTASGIGPTRRSSVKIESKSGLTRFRSQWRCVTPSITIPDIRISPISQDYRRRLFGQTVGLDQQTARDENDSKQTWPPAVPAECRKWTSWIDTADEVSVARRCANGVTRPHLSSQSQLALS